MVKKIIKPIFLILILLFMVLNFSACASVRAMVVTNADNTIDEIVTINLNAEEIFTLGKTVKEVQDYVYNLSYNEADKMCESLNTKIENDLLLNLTKEAKEVLESYYNGMEVITSNWQNNELTIGVRFKNSEIYKYYYDITEQNNKPTFYKEEHFLYTKIYFYANTMYTKHYELYKTVKKELNTDMPELATVDDCTLLYTYVTASRREHSNADYIQKINGEYYHTWIIDNPENEIIEIYYNVANVGMYIIICLGVALLATSVMLLVGLLLTIKKNKKLKN